MCVQRVMQFAAQYEDGYSTIVDQDGGGRHYVGRFVGEVSPIQNANDSYDLRDLTFEEYPGAPMLKYPSDWNRDSIYLNVATDGGKQNAATVGNWARGAYAADDARTLITLENAGTAGEFVAMEYRGYGFKLWMQTGPAYGWVQVYLDGVLQTKTFDDGSTSQIIECYSPDPAAPAEVLIVESVPLDLHRVKVVSLGQTNPASNSNAISFVRLQVMR